jgi:hypothetical protein
MACEKPVIARANTGNKTLIQDRYNGWLYETPNDFIELLEGMYSGSIRVETVCANAKKYTDEVHSFSAESSRWAHTVRKAFKC